MIQKLQTDILSPTVCLHGQERLERAVKNVRSVRSAVVWRAVILEMRGVGLRVRDSRITFTKDSFPNRTDGQYENIPSQLFILACSRTTTPTVTSTPTENSRLSSHCTTCYCALQ